MVRIMLDNKYKVQMKSLLCNKIYFFTYDVKITEPGHFPDPRIFQVGTSIAVEVQLQAWYFKPKKVSKVTCSYSFKPVGLY